METGHVYSKSDDRLRVIRELIKRDCLIDALEENQVERLAEALSKKPLSRWMQEDLKNILDLRHETAIWILIFLMDFPELLKDLTKDNQVYFLLHNQNLLNGCSGLPALMDKLLAQDPSWKNLKTELNISDAFVEENKSNIQKFIYEGGAEIMTSFLNRQPKKKEEIRRIVNIYGEEDKTELDAMNINDLDRLWLSLCPEFECKGNSVCYVERVG